MEIMQSFLLRLWALITNTDGASCAVRSMTPEQPASPVTYSRKSTVATNNPSTQPTLEISAVLWPKHRLCLPSLTVDRPT